jgi:hypothetical protein
MKNGSTRASAIARCGKFTRNARGYVDDWLRRPPALPPLPEQARKAGNARLRPHALHAPQPTGELISKLLKVGPLPSHRLDTLGTDLKIARQHLIIRNVSGCRTEGSTSLCNCVGNLLITRSCYPFDHQAAHHVLVKGIIPLMVNKLFHQINTFLYTFAKNRERFGGKRHKSVKMDQKPPRKGVH